MPMPVRDCSSTMHARAHGADPVVRASPVRHYFTWLRASAVELATSLVDVEEREIRYRRWHYFGNRA